MSHVVKTEANSPETAIRDLDVVAAAAARCGLQLNRNQKQFRSYGTSPACEHAITIPGKSTAYEIGLVPSSTHQGAFALAYDAWDGNIEAFAGADLCKLRQGLHAEKARKQAREQGDFYSETTLPDGSLVVEIDTTVRAGV